MLKFTEHARMKMARLGLSKDDVAAIIYNPEFKLDDIATHREIAIAKVRGKYHTVVFERHEEELTIITIFPISKNKILKRIESRGWIER